MRRFSLALSLFATLSLAACGIPSTLRVDAAAGPDLNPGPRGTANPAQVRLYQLKAPERFNNADYFQLADHEQAVLGDDLLGRTEVIIRPGETQAVTLQTAPGARYVAAAVAYRNIDGSAWRAVTPARGRMRLTLTANRVSLAPE